MTWHRPPMWRVAARRKDSLSRAQMQMSRASNALARVGLTLDEADLLSDRDLLNHPGIGPGILATVRSGILRTTESRRMVEAGRRN